MKRFLLALMICMFMFSLVSAFNFDNIKGEIPITKGEDLTIGNKTLEYSDLWETYKPIKIENAFGLGETLFEGAITKHNEYCDGYNCYSEFYVNIAEGYKLIEDAKIYENINGNWIERDIPINLQVLKEIEVVSKPIYETVCIKNKDNQYSKCNEVLVGYEDVEKEIWEDYQEGSYKDSGSYKIRISSIVTSDNNFDWRIKVGGKWIDEWAIWTPTSGIIGYYKLEESGNPIIDSNGINNGTIYDGARTTGKIDYGWSFADSPADWINLPETSTRINRSYSINGWFKLNAVGSDVQIIVWDNAGANGHVNYQLSLYGGKVNSGFTKNYDCNGGYSHVNGTTVVSDSTWYMATAVFDSSTNNLSVYLNGDYENSIDMGTEVPCSAVGTPIEARIGGAYTTVLGDFHGLNGVADEVYILNRTLSQGEITALYNNGDGITWQEYGEPTINLLSPNNGNSTTGLNATQRFIYNCSAEYYGLESLENMSIYTNESGGWDIKFTDDSLSGDFDYSSQAYQYADGTYKWGCEVCLNDSNCYFSASNYTFSYTRNSFIENSQTYSPTTLEGNLENFSINITLGDAIELSSAILNYNGETESGNIYSSDNNRIINVTNFQIPSVGVSTNFTFYWAFTFDDSSEANSTFNNQTVSNVSIDNCSAYSNYLLNLSLFDEETLLPINGTIEVYFQVQNKPNYESIQNYSVKYENINNTLICSQTDLSGQDLAYSAEIRYYTENYSDNSYATELYHIQKADIEGLVNISLYDLNLDDSTEFKIEYQDNTLTKVEEAIIQLQRKYISENIYRIVEAPITGDGGIAILHVDLDSNKYKIVVVKNGEVLDIFDNVVFICENELSGQCSQDLYGEIDPDNDIDIETLRDFAYALYFTNETVDVTFSIPSGTPGLINVVLTQKDQFGNTTTCNRTIISSGGSTSCSYNTTIGDSYITLIIRKDGEPMAIRTFIVPEASGVDFLDNNFFIVFIFMLSIIGMAFTSPEWIVLNGVIVMLVAGSLWLLNGLNFVIGLGGLAWLVIASAILILKLSKQEDQ